MNMNRRNYTPIDHLVMNADHAIRTLFGKPDITERPNPTKDCINEVELSEKERKLSAALMRINHAGEVSAQGLYRGQALTAKLPEVRAKMERAAQEENDHLDWCEKRLVELDSYTSRLNPVWYFGSLAMGATAGWIGDKWSLGFVVETEYQVIRHLDEHLGKLPKADKKSHIVLEQMKEDEAHHATIALHAGAAPLPWPVKKMMSITSKIMTRSTYWL